MESTKIFDAEFKFMNLVWDRAPIKSSELVKLAEDELGWKKSTTYTVIRRLSDRGIIKNEDSIVSVLKTRDKIQKAEAHELIDKVFDGSLKMFFTSFLQKEKLSKEELAELKKIVEMNSERGE